MDLWRISNFPNLSGEGGLRYSARWHTAGRPVVYLAASAPGAMLELLVRLEVDQDDVPRPYTLLTLQASEKLAILTLADLAPQPFASSLAASRALGDRWLQNAESALARVPSAIMPDTWNFLLNPLHPQAGLVAVVSVKKCYLDKRLPTSRTST